MRRVVLMVALALALPTAALADSILDYSNSTGSISASDSSLSITSTITTVSVVGGAILQTGDNLGTLSITAGAMTSGSAAAGGVFGPGTLTITATGGATLFSGTFSSATWTKGSTTAGMVRYTLNIDLNGNRGGSYQTAYFTTGDFTGRGLIASGDTSVVVPEPGTMGLLGTGLVGIAGLVRRKMKV
jgi:PEP-CTERM motif